MFKISLLVWLFPSITLPKLPFPFPYTLIYFFTFFTYSLPLILGKTIDTAEDTFVGCRRLMSLDYIFLSRIYDLSRKSWRKTTLTTNLNWKKVHACVRENFEFWIIRFEFYVLKLYSKFGFVSFNIGFWSLGFLIFKFAILSRKKGLRESLRKSFAMSLGKSLAEGLVKNLS